MRGKDREPAQINIMCVCVCKGRRDQVLALINTRFVCVEKGRLSDCTNIGAVLTTF